MASWEPSGCGSDGTTVDDILPLLKLDEEILEAEDWPRPKSELMEAASSEVQHIPKAQHLRAVQWVLRTMHVITISYRWGDWPTSLLLQCHIANKKWRLRLEIKAAAETNALEKEPIGLE